MKLPTLRSNRLPTDTNDFTTQMANSASALAGRGSGGIQLLLYASRQNQWSYGRTNLNPEDTGLLVVDHEQISRGYVEWVNKRPVQSIFAPILSGQEVTEHDLPNPCERAAYRGQSDGPAFTYQVVGAFLNSGNPFRFETSTKGGVGAVEDLAAAARAASIAVGECLHPVVELNSTSYPHPEYGTTYVPAFRIVGYVPKSVADNGNITEADMITDIEAVAEKAPEPAPTTKAGKSAAANGRRRGAAL